MAPHRRLGVWLACICLSGPLGATSPAETAAEPLPVQFVDVAPALGIHAYRNANGMGSGLAAADYDNDGDVDLFVPQAGGRADFLYRNRGDGTFDEIATVVGVASATSTRCALWLDYDADGRLDLFTVNDDPGAEGTFNLLRQVTPEQFVDVTAQAGLVKPPAHRLGVHIWGAVCAGDINRDGYIDLFTSEWFGPSHLFLNTGTGGFLDISDVCGMPVEREEEGELLTFTRHGSVMVDFDRDGWMDVFTAVDFTANELWLNQGNNTFVDVAVEAGVDNPMNDMGIALGDYDNDGDLDMYVTNIAIENKHNVLYRNDSVDGTLRFAEISHAMEVDSTGFGWGTTFLDVENDGDLDLAATNGYLQREWSRDTSAFFLNADEGGAPFREVGAEIGFHDTDYGSALLAADFDRDGDLDLVQACLQSPYNFGRLRLLDNRPTGAGSRGHYLVVRPRSERINRFAIGAVVRVVAGGRRLMRPITAGISYMSQEPAEAFFGLGEATTVDTVRIEWPDGEVTTLEDIAVDQVLDVLQPLPPNPPPPPPSALALAARNPVAGPIRLRLDLPASADTRLVLIDAAGRLVRDWPLGVMGPGAEEVTLWDSRSLLPGVYVLRLTQGTAVRTAKVALIP